MVVAKKPVKKTVKKTNKENAVVAKSVKERKHKIQRFLDKRGPLLVENTKSVLVIKGHHTSLEICNVLKDIAMLTKPHCKSLNRKNEILPFEDASSLEFLTKKADSSLFAFGSHTKKRPHNLILGRCFDSQILDMYEFGVEDFQKIGSFSAETKAVGSKPIFVFLGEKWENDVIYSRLQNLLIDFFRADRFEKISLKGLDHVLGWTILDDGKLYFRAYSIAFKKSGTKIPDVELEPMGPFMTLTLRRHQLPSNDMWNMSLKQAKNVLIPKKQKSITRNNMGDKVGRVHMTKQKLDGIITKGKKMKALRTMK